MAYSKSRIKSEGMVHLSGSFALTGPLNMTWVQPPNLFVKLLPFDMLLGRYH